MNALTEQVKSLPELLVDIFPSLEEAVREAFDRTVCHSLQRVFITGCGDSYHAALGSELAFESISGLPTEPMTAMQFSRYAAGFLPQSGPSTNLVIGISVSGSVSRTAEALTLGKQAGAVTLALTAAAQSPVAIAAERILLAVSPAFPEPPGTHTPGVRTFFVNQLALLLAAVRIGEIRGHVTQASAVGLRAQIRSLTEQTAETIAASDPAARALAREWKDAQEFVFVGSGPNYGTALFSAAKILEASGDSALGQETEEWCHLQYFARAANTPTLVISAGDRDLSRAEEMVVAARAIGRRVAVIAPQSAVRLIQSADCWLPVAEAPEKFSHVLCALPGALFAAYRSEVISEPYFRNFSGGRNIEGGGGISRIRTSATWKEWKP